MAAVIRLAQEKDAAQIAAIYAPSVLDSPASFELIPPTPAQMQERIAEVLAGLPWLVCENQEQIMGYVYASPHRTRAAYRWAVDVAVYVHPEHRRVGVGRALYTSLFELLKLQGICNAYAGITLPNAGSVGLHEAMGFQLIGIYREVGFKLGAWHDVGWWHLPLLPRPVPPEEPRPLRAVRDSEAWQAALASGLSWLSIGNSVP